VNRRWIRPIEVNVLGCVLNVFNQVNEITVGIFAIANKVSAVNSAQS
jgi:hypothetical protein